MIVRGYIIPKRDGERFLYSRVIFSHEAHQIFKDFDEMLKQVLNDFNERKRGIRTAKDMNEFLDALILFFRSILYRDVVPEVVPATIRYIYHFFVDKCLTEEKWDYSPERYFKELSKSSKTLQKDKEEFETLRSKLSRLLEFPADSRPGANTSSLFIHTLTTTAIASAFYLNNEEGNRVKSRDFDLAVLRLTCLFHDVGKLIDWRRHEEESSKYLKKLLSNYVKEEGLDIIDLAAELIKRESRRDLLGFEKLRKFYLEADRRASEVDRLSKFLLKLLEPEQTKLLLKKADEYRGRKIPEEEFEECYREFNYWRQFSIEELVKITEAFCKRVSVMSKDNPLFELEKADISSERSEVKIVRYDVRGIQSYIRINDLRSMAGASLLVDYIVFVGLPFILMEKHRIPAESVLYFGGGNVTVILPASKEEDISKEVSESIRKTVNLNLTKGSSFFGKSFFQVNSEIDEELARMKLKGYDDSTIFHFNIFAKCEFCGQGDVEEIKDEKICSSCNKKRETGKEFHFLYKLERLTYPSQQYPNYLMKMIEYISGSPREEIEGEKIERYKNLAILRLDANIAGLFMASSISITDALERSVRIDSSLKGAYYKFLSVLKNIDRSYYDRMVLGTIYMGGDDGFLLVPSKIAIHLALAMMNEFYLEMGGKLSLSCGIAVAKPKHPLILLYDAAGFILDDVVKENTRGLAYQECASAEISKPSLIFRGALGFYTANGGFMDRESLKTIMRELYHEGISGQNKRPYLLCSTASENGKLSIFTLFNILKIPGIAYSNDLSNFFEVIKKVLKWLLKDGESAKEHIKKTQRIINDILKVDIRGDSSPKIQSLYIKRQAERKEEEKSIAEGLLNLLEMKNGEIRFHIYDLLLLTKVMMGE